MKRHGIKIVYLEKVERSTMGLMPELDVIAKLSGMMGSNAPTAWIAYLAIGTIMWAGCLRYSTAQSLEIIKS